MKKLIYTFLLIPVLWGALVTIPVVRAEDEEVVIEDERMPDAKIT